MTIVKNINFVLGHKFLKLGEDFRLAIEEASKPRQSTAAWWLPLEALLQIAQRPAVRLEDIDSPEFRRSIELFIGAVHSSGFMRGTQSANYQRAQLILKPLSRIRPDAGWGKYRLSATHIYEGTAQLRDEFERLELDPEAVWLWNGWGGPTKQGDNISFPLYAFYERLGRDFTARLNGILQRLTLGSSVRRIRGLAELAEFIDNYPGAITPADFANPYWTGKFFNEFARFFFKRAHSRGLVIRYAARAWSTQFLTIADAMVAGSLIASPEPPIAAPRSGVVVGGRETRIVKRADGVEMKANCLTPIPLELSDSDAKEVLFRKVIDDFAAVVTWAEAEVDDLWKRHEVGLAAAATGAVRPSGRPGENNNLRWMTSPENPKGFANCAASFWVHGLRTDLWATLTYGQFGLVKIARDLGIPTPRAFLPHAALIVANHCEVTTRFLTNLVLFDKDGRQTGVQTVDGVTYLVGYKPRKGAELAEQRVPLNSRTEEVIRQVIALTEPLRNLLRDRGDDRWRRLFLAVKSIAAVPNPQNFVVQTAKRASYGEHGFDQSLSSRAHISLEAAAEIGEHFTLRALRGSAALVIYINTGSSLLMSQALGHETYSSKLLDHYLPEPIQRFFRERWIRIFQAGLVCEAMRGSQMLLDASGFKTMDELDNFLNEHALKNVPGPQRPKTNGASPDHTELVIDVGEQMLTLLLSVKEAVAGNTASSNGKAIYWAEIGARVGAYLETLSDRPDLQASLAAARLNASAELVSELVRE